MKRIVILGSTGSIGENTLRVVSALPGRLSVSGIAVEKNYQRALEQAAEYDIPRIAVADPVAARACREQAPGGVTVLSGNEGVSELAGTAGADVVLCAVVGIAGLAPVIAALERGADVALATKEVLVAAGHVVTETARRNNARLLPVDSEHCAIFQLLCDRGSRPACPVSPGDARDIKRLVLTASGGPFAGNASVELDQVTVNQALEHPRWNMGPKVTIDSATLMNKGLEIMEAQWLFGMPVSAIDVVIHPESIVHSIVEFVDGTMTAQMSLPDMRFAIQYALTWPERCDGGLPGLDLIESGALHFRAPDNGRFPALELARHAAVKGGTCPAVLNASNEVAVARFIEGQIPFPGIWETVERVLNEHSPVADPSLADIVEADRWARECAGES